MSVTPRQFMKLNYWIVGSKIKRLFAHIHTQTHSHRLTETLLRWSCSAGGERENLIMNGSVHGVQTTSQWTRTQDETYNVRFVKSYWIYVICKNRRTDVGVPWNGQFVIEFLSGDWLQQYCPSIQRTQTYSVYLCIYTWIVQYWIYIGTVANGTQCTFVFDGWKSNAHEYERPFIMCDAMIG